MSSHQHCRRNDGTPAEKWWQASALQNYTSKITVARHEPSGNCSTRN
jgi:hypothetical protein